MAILAHLAFWHVHKRAPNRALIVPVVICRSIWACTRGLKPNRAAGGPERWPGDTTAVLVGARGFATPGTQGPREANTQRPGDVGCWSPPAYPASGAVWCHENKTHGEGSSLGATGNRTFLCRWQAMGGLQSPFLGAFWPQIRRLCTASRH